MVIVEDTRQQGGKHDIKHNYFKEQGIAILRSKLPFGDYALVPTRAVDTKMNVYELASDIDQQHERFKRECIGARDSGCQLYVLVENEDGINSPYDLSEWQEPDEHFNMRKRKSGNPRTRRIEGKRLARACDTMSTRYGVKFMFCSPEESGQIIYNLLTGGNNEEREDA